MGSWTDNQPTQFRPYVRQIPLEAEVNVGTTLQGRYNEGVQRIQSQIDRVAGMSIMRDVDKQYLQSKLNSLGNNLRILSVGDFSNYQLVNSVGGMINQVGKDKYVQAAVGSTARVQKELSAMDSARKEGKSDKNNEQYFYEKVLNPYLTSGMKDDLGNPITFNGSYSPYVNITEEVRKLAKDAGVDESLIQQMFLTDRDGKFIPDEKGHVIPAKTMTEVVSSSNAKAIEGIMNSVLSRGDVQNQLSIDSWANTKGVDAVKMASNYEKRFNENLSSIDQEIVKYNTLLKGTVTPEQEKELNDNIKKLNGQRTKYKDQLDELKSLAQSDPERFKQQMYRTNYENSLRDIFIKNKREEKNLQSPLTQQLNWEQKFKLDQSSEMFDRDMAIKNYNLDVSKFNAEWSYDPSTGKWTKNDGKNTSGVYDDDTGASNPGTQENASLRFEEGTLALERGAYDSGFNLLYEILNRDKNPEASSKETLQKTIEARVKEEGGTSYQLVTKWLKDIDNQSKIDGIKLTARDRSLMNTFNKNRDAYTNNTALDAYINDLVKKEVGINPKDYLRQLVPASVAIGDKIQGYTKQDMLDYAMYDDDPIAKKRLNSRYPAGFGGRDNFKYYVMDVLQKKYGKDYDSWAGSREWMSLMSTHERDYSKLKEAMAKREDLLKRVTYTDQHFSIPGGEATPEIKAAKQRMISFINGADKLSGEDADKGEMTKWLLEDKSAVMFTVFRPFREGDPFTGTATIVYGDASRTVNIENQDDLEKITQKKFIGFKANPYLTRAKVSENHSTNLGTDPSTNNAWNTAYIPPDDMVGLKNSDKYIPLGADLVLMPDKVDGKEVWSITLHVKNKQTGSTKPIEFDSKWFAGSEDQIINYLSKLNTAQLDKITSGNQK